MSEERTAGDRRIRVEPGEIGIQDTQMVMSGWQNWILVVCVVCRHKSYCGSKFSKRRTAY